MPLLPRVLEKDDFMTLAVRGEAPHNLGPALFWGFINGGISLVLVLLGGFFAGLTLACVASIISF